MRAGDAVWNPLTGEKALLVESAEESGGARIVSDFAVERDGFVPGGEHVHDHCAEHFEVRAGRISFVLDGDEKRNIERYLDPKTHPSAESGLGRLPMQVMPLERRD